MRLTVQFLPDVFISLGLSRLFFLTPFLSLIGSPAYLKKV